MTGIIDRLLDEAEKAQRKGHLLLAEVCRDASDQLGLVMDERDRMREALRVIIVNASRKDATAATLLDGCDMIARAALKEGAP